MNIGAFMAVSFVIACIPMGIWMGRKRIVEKGKRIKDRPSVPVEEIYRLHYSDSGLDKDVVISLWKQVASTLKMDPKKLQPTDRFKEELGPVKGYPTPDEVGDLENILEKRCKELRVDCRPGMLTNLDNFIRFFITGRSS
jgi:hypothetical protein